MGEIVGIAQAKNDLSELVNRAAYGGERIVIASRGKPKAAVISMADLQKLEMFEKGAPRRPTIEDLHLVEIFERETEPRGFRAILADAAALREEIAKERDGRPSTDSVEDIRAIRLDRAH